MGLLDDAIREHLDLRRRRGADPAEIERAEREALGPVRREPLHGAEPPVSSLVDHDPGRGSLAFSDETPEYTDSVAAEAPAELYTEEALAYDDLVAHEDESMAPEIPEREDELLDEPRPRRRFFGRRSAEPESREPSEPLPPSEFDDDDPFLSDASIAEPHRAGEGWEDPTTPGELNEDHAVALDEGDVFEVESQSAAPIQEDATRIPSTAPHEADDRGQVDGLDRVPVDDLDGGTMEYDVEREFTHDEPGLTPRPERPVRPEQGEEDVLEETPDFLQDAPDHDRLWFEQKPPRDFDFDG